jgi:hypothetical protein
MKTHESMFPWKNGAIPKNSKFKIRQKPLGWKEENLPPGQGAYHSYMISY